MATPTRTVGSGTSSSAKAWLVRFDGVERAVHWSNAMLFTVLIFTGVALYYPPLIGLIGRRHLVEEVHLYTGLALPLPILAALGGSWGRGLRADLRRFNRWSRSDRQWLRERLTGRAVPKHGSDQTGKFNPGQKLNAAFTAGAGLAMLASGAILAWYRPFPLSWREGATFVHDWGALAFVVVIAGHVAMALSHPESLRSMFTGRIAAGWARRHAPRWWAETTSPTPSGDGSSN